GTHQDRNASPVFVDDFLLAKTTDPGRRELLYRSRVHVTPLRWSQTHPRHTPRENVATGVTYQSKDRVIDFDDVPVQAGHENADDSGVAQASEAHLCHHERAPGLFRSAS